MRTLLRAVAALIVLFVFATLSQAQLGFIQKGLVAAKGGKSDANVAGNKTGSKGYDSPQTFTNAEHGFTYTVPAGWQLVSGQPTGNNVVFMKPGTTWSFQFHFTAMTPDFPSGTSVAASLKQATQEVKTGKYLEAKRRDQGDKKKKCGVIGWEVTETPTGGGGSHQRMIWQCYDGGKNYYNFMVASSPDQFASAKSELRTVLDSVTFCK